MSSKIRLSKEIQREIDRVIKKVNKLHSYTMRKIDKKNIKVVRNYLKKASKKLEDFNMKLPISYY
jgi:predicted DNA-binding protein